MEIVKGNLITLAEQGHFDVIIQGCNCFNTMGSGIAKEIKEKYPAAYTADCTTVSGDHMKLGTYTSAIATVTTATPGIVHGFVIVNAYTQYGTNKSEDFQDLFEYTAFQLILEKLAKYAKDTRFGFPLIGSGLAGGDKHRIMRMIELFADTIETNGCTVTVVEFTPN